MPRAAVSASAHRKLLRQFQRYRLESERQIERLRLMIEVAGLVASTLELPILLNRIMEGATRVLNAEASALMVWDEEKNELFFEVALGQKAEQVKRVRVKKGQGVAGWVFKHGQTLLVPNAGKDPRHAQEIARSVEFPVRSILCTPLRERDETIGVVEVLNKLGADGPAFSEDDIPFFEAFAAQSATAISQARAHEELKDLFDSTILSISAALDARDPYTHGHSGRVTEYALAIAEQIGVPEQDRHDLRLAALLHDIGKMGVPDAVLLKSGKLTHEEYEVMKKHPVIGYNIVKPIAQLKRSLDGIRYHHERVDGGGYPDGLRGDEIPLQGRILAVADCFDALTSNRSYRKRYPAAHALELIDETKGTQHEARLVEALLEAYKTGKIILKSAEHRVD